MTMNDFAQIIKQSHIIANRKTEIIFQLLQALGAGEAMGEAAKGMGNRVSERSPSYSTIQKWIKDKGKPDTIRYFPNLKVENENEAHAFFRKTPKEDQWIELRDLFREWYDNQNIDGYFCINTETDDLIEFSTSFWRQFISFFPSLNMWDNMEEGHPEKERNQNNFKDKVANEMLDVFKEKYMQYKIYEFIPKEIDSIFDSLYIYHKILNEQEKLNESITSDCDTISEFKKMYYKWFPGFDYFVFHEATCRGDYWELKLSGKSILVKFDKNFDPEIVPTNTWMKASFRYTFVDSSIIEDPQFNAEIFLWEKCQGEIIIIDINYPIDYDSLNDKKYPIIEDCFVIIDGMLELESLIDEFMIAINLNYSRMHLLESEC